MTYIARVLMDSHRVSRFWDVSLSLSLSVGHVSAAVVRVVCRGLFQGYIIRRVRA